MQCTLIFAIVRPIKKLTLRATVHRRERKLRGAKVPGNESSMELSFLGAKVPGNESSRELSLLYGLFVPWTIRTTGGLFVPWTIRTMDYSYVGLFVRWTFRTTDYSYYGLFVPSVKYSHNINCWCEGVPPGAHPTAVYQMQVDLDRKTSYLYVQLWHVGYCWLFFSYNS